MRELKYVVFFTLLERPDGNVFGMNRWSSLGRRAQPRVRASRRMFQIDRLVNVAVNIFMDAEGLSAGTVLSFKLRIRFYPTCPLIKPLSRANWTHINNNHLRMHSETRLRNVFYQKWPHPNAHSLENNQMRAVRTPPSCKTRLIMTLSSMFPCSTPATPRDVI